MRKIKYLLIGISLILLLSACEPKSEKESEKVETTETKTEEKIVTEEITTGTIDGYTFEETDEVTDRVKIQMNNGDIMLIVLSNKATPITIANFKKLVSEKFYDGITFHRIVKDFMIQGGDPTGTGYHGSDETIKGEFSSNGVKNTLSHTKGVISMARATNPNSASSQFFICTSDKYTSSLDGNYAAFGKVFAGWDTLEKLNNTKVVGETPIEKPVIKSIRFINIKTS